MGLQRSLVYVLFVLVVVYLLSLHFHHSQTLTIWRATIKDMAGTPWGKAFCRRRKDGSYYLVIKLKDKFPEGVIVLVCRRDHLRQELGRFKGASFIMTLPPGLDAKDILGIKLIGVKSGRVWAQTSDMEFIVSPKK